ncbi:MAG: hypothetical protein QOF89_1285 [Acidobacteriota bacterium]|jgi:hypothetical protein|nr:hypothetical protein [Acidobacteriota bacterium]
MAATGFSFAEKTSRWAVLVTNVKEILPDVPHLTDDVGSLERLVGEGRVLESRQDDLRSQFQENTKKIKALISQGETLRGRLTAGLQSKFGFRSETLLKFGVKPRRAPRRKAAEKPVPQPATTPTTNTK